jgi:hypothetical protein
MLWFSSMDLRSSFIFFGALFYFVEVFFGCFVCFLVYMCFQVFLYFLWVCIFDLLCGLFYYFPLCCFSKIIHFLIRLGSLICPIDYKHYSYSINGVFVEAKHNETIWWSIEITKVQKLSRA